MRELNENEKVLIESLERYFDCYRMAHNAIEFRRNVETVKTDIALESAQRTLNFYSEDEKRGEMISRMQERYASAGFSHAEWKELLAMCDLKNLDKLEIHDIKILAKIGEIFRRFMGGDTAQYTVLSAGLLLPAIINGYAPMALSNAFQKNHPDMLQVALYALLTTASSGLSLALNKKMSDFLDKKFAEKKGIAGAISQNVASFPADQIQQFGMHTIKSRIANAKDGYRDIFALISHDVLPSIVTLVTSAIVLYEKNPILALGTVAGNGLMMGLDSFLQRKTGWWDKRRKAEQRREQSTQQTEEQLNAHMEIVLSGMKDDLAQRMEELLSKERIAESEKDFAQLIRDKVGQLSSAVNMISAAVVAYLAGGTMDKFVAGLVYSGNIQQGISSLLSSKRYLLGSFRNIMQMELMFNGYAAEEQEKEATRTGIDHVPNGTITLDKVHVKNGTKEILRVDGLSIPEGGLVNFAGASGAGKTTLMKIISGYYRPTEGDVRMGGVPLDSIKKSGPDSIYSAISYLPQFPYILEGTIKDNIVFGLPRTISPDAVEDVLAKVGLSNRFKNLDERLAGGRGDMGTTSGGETARIGLARVLLKIRNTDSRIVFLDEPTASVDEETRDNIAEIIVQEKKNHPQTTFIVISHDKEFVEKLNCTQTITLEKGKIK